MSKPVILFESYPDFSGSPLAIYNELVNRGYNSKYDLIWAVYSDFSKNTNYKIVKFFNCNSAEKTDVLNRVKIIIDSNRYITKPRPNVYRLHTRHGTNLKKCPSYSRGIGAVDLMLSPSIAMQQIDHIVYPAEVANKTIVLGMPCNDELFKPFKRNQHFLAELAGRTDFAKIIGWFPTYRQHRANKNNGSSTIFTYGVPLFKTVDDINRINDILKEKNILLIIQRHHAQAKNYTEIPKCSNIIVISDNIKSKYNLSLTDLLKYCDAMITDYSSIYFEYLLLNKPIALCVEDLVEYSKTFGFWYNYLEWIKGTYLITSNSLAKFIIEIAGNKDSSKSFRDSMLHKSHTYQDGHSAIRVVDYLIKEHII